MFLANKYHPIFDESCLLSKVQELEIAKPSIGQNVSRTPTMCVFCFENHPTILVSHDMTSPFGQQTKQRNHPFLIRHGSTHSLYVLLPEGV